MKRLLLLFIAATVLVGCSSSEPPPKKSSKRELLIYCGITMINPMREIANIIEKEHNCTITLMQGGSKDLYQSLKLSKKGDLYLPGSESYRSKNMADGLLMDYIFVGHNQAALLVGKGNPKQITADINNLTNKKYAVAIGNTESGSIGHQAQKVLGKAGIYDEVVNNALELAADSRTMNKLLIDGSVDLIFNWRATAYFAENKEFMTPLILDKSIAPKNRLLINLLSFTEDVELARHFMTMAGSSRGQQIFHKYGFLDQVGAARAIKK